MGETMREAIRSQIGFLKRHLEQLVHIPVKDERGHIVNGFAAAQIPDWQMRQQVADLEAVLGQPTQEELYCYACGNCVFEGHEKGCADPVGFTVKPIRGQATPR